MEGGAGEGAGLPGAIPMRSRRWDLTEQVRRLSSRGGAGEIRFVPLFSLNVNPAS